MVMIFYGICKFLFVMELDYWNIQKSVWSKVGTPIVYIFINGMSIVL
jgi:hypothetical protein